MELMSKGTTSGGALREQSFLSGCRLPSNYICPLNGCLVYQEMVNASGRAGEGTICCV